MLSLEELLEEYIESGASSSQAVPNAASSPNLGGSSNDAVIPSGDAAASAEVSCLVASASVNSLSQPSASTLPLAAGRGSASLPCWGSLVSGTIERCTPGFSAGINHFKNKFCPNCRASIVVPVDYIRALTPELCATLSVNSKMGYGFWKDPPPNVPGGRCALLGFELAWR